jgi:hypothetical protein
MDDHGATADGPSPWHVALVAEPSGITRRLAQTLGQLAEHGVPGCELELAAGPEAPAARRATLLERLATGGLRATRARSWQRSLAALAGIYAHALAPEPVARAA